MLGFLCKLVAVLLVGALTSCTTLAPPSPTSIQTQTLPSISSLTPTRLSTQTPTHSPTLTATFTLTPEPTATQIPPTPTPNPALVTDEQIEALFAGAGVETVCDDRVTGNTDDLTICFTGGIWDLMKVQQVNLGPTQDKFRSYAWARLGNLMRRVFRVPDSEFYNKLVRMESDWAATDYKGWVAAGDQIRTKLGTGWLFPLRGYDQNGLVFNADIRRIEIYIVSPSEWQALMTNAEELDLPVLQRWYWLVPPGKEWRDIGGFLLFNDDTMIMVTYNNSMGQAMSYWSSSNSKNLYGSLTSASSVGLMNIGACLTPFDKVPTRLGYSYNIVTNAPWSVSNICETFFNSTTCQAEISSTFVK